MRFDRAPIQVSDYLRACSTCGAVVPMSRHIRHIEFHVKLNTILKALAKDDAVLSAIVRELSS